MSIIRRLYARLGSAPSVYDHLLQTVEVRRDEPVTYTDLVELIGPEAVKAFDEQLAQAGLGWFQRQLAGAGVMFGDDRIQATLSSLTDARKSALDAVKALGVHTEPQWAVYGLASEPTLQEIEDAIAGLAIDGHAMSVAVSLTPGRESVAVSITEMAGTDRVRVVHSFTAGKRGLNETQQAFLAGLLALAKAYRDEVI